MVFVEDAQFHSSTLTFDASDYDRDGDADNGMQDSSSDDFDFAAQVSFTYEWSRND